MFTARLLGGLETKHVMKGDGEVRANRATRRLFHSARTKSIGPRNIIYM